MSAACKIDDLPGPAGLPLLGSALKLQPAQMHRVIEDWVREYGETLTFRLGPRQVVVISDPAMMAEALKDRPHRFRRLLAMEDIARELDIHGVFSAEGEDWKRHRRAWMQALSIHQVKPFFARMDGITERLRQHWLRAAAQGKAVDVEADLMRYTVDVTTLFAFGIDANTLEQDGDAIQQHLGRVFHMLNRRLAMPVPYWRWFRLPEDRRLDDSMQVVRDYVNGTIAEARERIKRHPELAEAPTNLLEALLVARDEDGSTFTDQEIFGNTLTALLAGEDTTAHTIGWMIHLLIEHPQEQARLREAVDAALGPSLEQVPRWNELEAADALFHVDCVMSEALRIKPVAPLIFLCANEDTVLGDLRLPAGTDLILSLRSASLRESEYPQAKRFDPSRWGREQKKFSNKPPMPFGGGPRMCPGRSLAQMEIKSVISMLVRNFEFSAADAAPVTERMAFTLVPENLRVTFRPRKREMNVRQH